MKNFIFSQCDTVLLAKKYGTPLYVVSEDCIVERIDEIKKDFLNKHENTWAVYASKAFLTKEMARLIKREGLGMDVVSGGELYTALQVDFPVDKIVFHGNNKTPSELDMAIINNVGRIVVDNLYELELIQDIAEKHNRKINILFRITPGVNSSTHKYIQTGQVDSKFGIPINDGIVYKGIEKSLASNHINLLGFHFHVGSQLYESESYIEAIKVITGLMKKIKDKYDFETTELNVGGGYGISFNGKNKRKPVSYYTDAIVDEVEKNCNHYNLKRPTIVIEPGRWIVGEAGITLYTIGSIKRIPGIRTYVGIDGGMSDNPRPSLYDAEYEGVIANKIGLESTEIVTIAGKCCESGDILIRDLKVPEVESGDILAILSTGAYNYSMASNYNKIPRPAVVMCSKGKDRLIVKRETYEDIIRNEI